MSANVKKASKGKKVRKVVEEVKPSPMGRRVEPRFDSIRKKAEGDKRKVVKSSCFLWQFIFRVFLKVHVYMNSHLPKYRI